MCAPAATCGSTVAEAVVAAPAALTVTVSSLSVMADSPAGKAGDDREPERDQDDHGLECALGSPRLGLRCLLPISAATLRARPDKINRAKPGTRSAALVRADRAHELKRVAGVGQARDFDVIAECAGLG